MKVFSKIYMWVVFALLYAPIIVFVVFSFNKANTLNNFTGFTLHWYKELFGDERALAALKNSLILAVLSAVIATVIGTLAAYGINRMRNKYVKTAVKSVTNIPMMNPDIITGVSMMLLFVGAAVIPIFSEMGFWSMLVAHITFNLPYVILSVLPKFKQMDKHLSEAALDLGCTPAKTFLKVELPFIMPGVVSGLMLSFTLSLDDFVISHFVSGQGTFETLPLYIYNMTAHDVKYSMYALCALMVFAILILMLIVNFVGSDKIKHKGKKKKTT